MITPQLELALDFERDRDLAAAVAAAAQRWRGAAATERLWRRDATLWSGGDEARWLAWLDSPQDEAARVAEYRRLAARLLAPGIDHVLLLGMGGSSLGPLVVSQILAAGAGRALWVLDSTDPDTITRVGLALPPARTVVVAASKSGTTLESALLLDLFFARYRTALGEAARERFVAITDPGSQLEQLARRERFGAVVLGVPEIGGRFSVLSPFGLLPAALLAVDPEALLAGARAAAAACHHEAVEANPGVRLGLLLGSAPATGRHLVPVGGEPALSPLGVWFEQLLAESTGKNGTGLLPIVGEPMAPAPPRRDRVGLVFAEPHTPAAPTGAPCARLLLGRDAASLGGAFFVLEVATAVAGAVLGINPFDQPDVEAAKVKTRAIVAAIESGAAAREARSGAGGSETAPSALRIHGGADAATLPALLRAAARESYCALLAFLDPRPPVLERLARLRAALSRRGVTTTLGVGPRYLHSTGQLYKGGRPGGVFLLLTEPPRHHLAVPGRALTFAQVRDAQATGDAAVLRERGRLVVEVELDAAELGLDALITLVERELGAA